MTNCPGSFLASFRPARLTALLCLLGSACGGTNSPTPGRTTVTIEGGSRLGNANGSSRILNLSSTLLQRPLFDSNQSTLMSGGIMVYFQGINGTTAAYGQFIGNESSTNTLSIQNGVYRAFSLGFTEIGMTGALKCGVGNSGNSIIFNGTNQVVSFAISNAGCANFTAYHNGAAVPVPPVIVKSCLRVATTSTVGSYFCPPQQIGNVLSMAFQFRTFIREQGLTRYTSDPTSLSGTVGGSTGSPLPQSIHSNCNTLTAGVSAPLTIPIGKVALPFQMPLAIYGFQTAACTGTFGTYLFDSNLIASPAALTLPNGTVPTLTSDDVTSLVELPSEPEAAPVVKLLLRDLSANL